MASRKPSELNLTLPVIRSSATATVFPQTPPAGAPWQLGSSSPPRRRPTGRLYSELPDGFAVPASSFKREGHGSMRYCVWLF